LVDFLNPFYLLLLLKFLSLFFLGYILGFLVITNSPNFQPILYLLIFNILKPKPFNINVVVLYNFCGIVDPLVTTAASNTLTFKFNSNFKTLDNIDFDMKFNLQFDLPIYLFFLAIQPHGDFSGLLTFVRPPCG
jgi:hypothetical protein